MSETPNEQHDDYEENENPRTISKPDQLLALHSVTAEMFMILRKWFGVPNTLVLDLEEIDSAVTELSNPLMIAGMTMRKLQALHLLATPGVKTTTDVVITIVQDMQRALMQAPVMHLKLQAEKTDWDAAFEQPEDETEQPQHQENELHEILQEFDKNIAAMTVEDFLQSEGKQITESSITSAEELDREVEHFHELHSKLHEAVFAVLEASEGEICIFE